MVILKATELILLLNQLPDMVTVRAPLLGCRLFSLDLSGRLVHVKDIISANDYNAARDAVRNRVDSTIASVFPTADTPVQSALAEALRRELPDYGRLRDVLRQAGVVEPENLGEIHALLKQARESNPARGGDIYYFAFDNNALRNRLYSQFFRDPRYNFVLAKQVRNELDCREGKLQGDTLAALNALLPGMDAQSIFQNQNRLRDRLRLLAQAEWNLLLASGGSEVVKTGREQPNALSDSDLIIIATYEQFADNPGRKVVLFSSDHEFVVQSGGRTNLLGRIVRYPDTWAGAYQTRWEAGSRLLYQTAVVYGRLDLEFANADVMRLCGVWYGKGADDWKGEQMRVKMDTGASTTLCSIHEVVERNLGSGRT